MSSASLGRTKRVTAIILGVLLVLMLLALAVLWFVQRDRVLPNTTVEGIAAGGMTTSQLQDELTPIATSRETEPVTFTFEGQEHALDPTEVGFEVDVDATIAAAFARGRDGLPGDIGVRIRSYRNEATFELQQTIDEAALTAWVDELADQLDREEVRGEVHLDPQAVQVTIEPSQGEVVVDRDAAVEQARAALLGDGTHESVLPAHTTPQPIADDDLDELAAQIETALADPLVLRAGDEALTLEPTALAQMISVEEAEGGQTGTTLTFVVDEDAVDEVIGDVARGRFDTDPVSASYTADRSPPSTFDAQSDATYEPVEVDVGIEQGRNGARFDPATTAAQLEELLGEATREADIALETVEPTLSNEAAEELLPTHAIGTFTTYFTAGQTRNTNIQLLADTIDGALVLPGEQFSINDISGERSCDKGYVPAGTIIRGELVDTCGGGTSQFGTTTFNAAFFSGVQLDQWQAHSWYISRYPMGREATLTYPQLDVRFTNTTDGAILVKTSHTGSSVTVTLLGQPFAESVSATHGSPTDPRTFSTTERTNPSLAPGSQSTIQGGTNGFTVTVSRTVNRLDGGTDTQEIRTVYQPQTRIIEHGPPAPAATSSDTSDDDEDDTDDTSSGDEDDGDDDS